MDALSSKHNKKAVKTALATLPKEIDTTYDEALQRIEIQNEEDQALAKDVIMWLTCALRPLKVNEVQHAVAMTQNPEFAEENDKSCCVDEDALTDVDILTSVCVGLVVIDNTSTMRLVRELIR
jgi:hypothetical protein